jgi:DNA-binding NarL/FixJ family response regulator
VTTVADVKHAAIRVVIAEDQALVRRGTALLLSMAPDMECVGQASNGDEAVKLALVLRPDIVLMDLHMPIKGGVAATREITLAQPNTQVLVLTTLDDDETVFEAVRAGAQAYLLKDASEEELLETIRALRRGESRLTPQIARKVMDQFRHLARARNSYSPTTGQPAASQPAASQPAASQPAASQPAASQRAASQPAATIGADFSTEELTDKEERVLRLITDGSSNRQIAQAMALAEGTVKNYVSRIMSKLHANTRTELAVRMHGSASSRAPCPSSKLR